MSDNNEPGRGLVAELRAEAAEAQTRVQYADPRDGAVIHGAYVAYEHAADLAARYEQEWQVERAAMFASVCTCQRKPAGCLNCGRVSAVDCPTPDACTFETFDELLKTLQAERQAHADLRAGLGAVQTDAEILAQQISELRVKRTGRDSRADDVRNAWKGTIIDLIGPRASRIAVLLAALLAPAHGETDAND